MTYDSLGRKRTMSDPDMGAWSYQYDVEHMAGHCRVRSAGLHPLHATACTLVTRCGSIQFVHIPRAVNRLADALAWEALGGTAALLWAMRQQEGRATRKESLTKG